MNFNISINIEDGLYKSTAETDYSNQLTKLAEEDSSVKEAIKNEIFLHQMMAVIHKVGFDVAKPAIKTMAIMFLKHGSEILK